MRAKFKSINLIWALLFTIGFGLVFYKIDKKQKQISILSQHCINKFKYIGINSSIIDFCDCLAKDIYNDEYLRDININYLFNSDLILFPAISCIYIK